VVTVFRLRSTGQKHPVIGSAGPRVPREYALIADGGARRADRPSPGIFMVVRTAAGDALARRPDLHRLGYGGQATAEPGATQIPTGRAPFARKTR